MTKPLSLLSCLLRRREADAASRFGHSRVGTWLPEGRPEAAGQWAGLYRPEGKAQASGLTVLRKPATPATAPIAAAVPAAPRAVHLPGGRHGVLLFHGLSSTPLELLYLARGLHRAGYTVRVAVLDGYTHGLPASAPRTHVEWVEAAVAEFDRMRAQCETLAVGGLCIGALLSLAVAARRSSQVSHVLALSTTLHYDDWAAPWSRWLLPLARVVPWTGRIAAKEREPFGLKDERLRAWVAAQMRETGGSNAGAAVLRVKDLLQAQDLMTVVRAGLPSVCAATLLVHARDDDAASPRSAYEVAAQVAAKRVHCVILNDSYHMISIDKEKARVLAEMKAFLAHDAPSADAVESAQVEETVDSRSKEYVRS